MNAIIHATVALLAVINPMVCATMIAKKEAGRPPRVGIASAVKAMLAVLAILLIAAFVGHSILNAFGISMEAFKVVGGIILSFIGFRMIAGNQDSGTPPDADPSLMSVVLFAASPGTLTMVITLAAANDGGTAMPVSTAIGAIAAVAITIAVVSLVLLFSGKKAGGGSGLVSTYMGLIIAAMGLQFMLDGLKNFFF